MAFLFFTYRLHRSPVIMPTVQTTTSQAPFTPKMAELTRRFHLQPKALPAEFDDRAPRTAPGPGELMFITGPSGSGKSSTLRALRPALVGQLFDLADVELPDASVIDCLQSDVPEAIRLLARVGLAEVHLCFLWPAQLSDGQRWRLKLAIVFERIQSTAAHCAIVADEFCAMLDRLTAAIVCQQLRAFVDRHRDRVCAIVVSSQDELAHPLEPDRIVTCDFD